VQSVPVPVGEAQNDSPVQSVPVPPPPPPLCVVKMTPPVPMLVPVPLNTTWAEQKVVRIKKAKRERIIGYGQTCGRWQLHRFRLWMSLP
jgi:hypothetical protein